jgi:hypothetical protein
MGYMSHEKILKICKGSCEVISETVLKSQSLSNIQLAWEKRQVLYSIVPLAKIRSSLITVRVDTKWLFNFLRNAIITSCWM